MKDHFDKLLVERPRTGGHGKCKDVLRNVDAEDLPQRESMRRRHHTGNRKRLNEFLSPLKRFLRSKIGQIWDDVYSEICENINCNNAVQFHILQHLDGYVFTKCHKLDGRDGIYTWDYGREIRVDEQDKMRAVAGPLYPRFYVHPETGMLHEMTYRGEKNTWQEKNRLEKLEYFRKIGEYEVLKKIDGIWYHCYLKVHPLADTNDFWWKAHLSYKHENEWGKNDAGKALMLDRKVQLNGKALKKHGIKNQIAA
jgi:hypothetical protein